MLSFRATYQNHIGSSVINASYQFEGKITATREEGDYTITVIDDALEVKDISLRVRQAALDKFQPNHLKNGALALAIFAAFYCITQITSATLDQSFLVSALTHRRMFAVALLTAFVVHAYFSFFPPTIHLDDLMFFSQNQVGTIQNIRQSAKDKPDDLFVNHPERWCYFHDLELLKLIILVRDQIEISDDASKLMCLARLNRVIQAEGLQKRFALHMADFWNPLLEEWKQLNIPDTWVPAALHRGEQASAPRCSEHQWANAMGLIKKISAKVSPTS